MKKMVMVVAALAFGVAFGVEDDDYFKVIDSSTTPGLVLQNHHRYDVLGKSVVINAKKNPGLSALRVAPGSEVILNIPAGCTLTVIGGDAEGPVGAGAGIEVPYAAKLVISGEGTLNAIGGNAANGAKGLHGGNGAMNYLLDVHGLPLDNEKALEKKMKELEEDIFDTLDFLEERLLYVGNCGSGGEGGAGGGGAGAGIGGKGGNGGKGGAKLQGRRCSPADSWQGIRGAAYHDWYSMLGWGEPYLYSYSNFSHDGRNILCDGKRGNAGAKGSSGQACGEVIIAETVRVTAAPGTAGRGGMNGFHGKAFSTYDAGYDDTTIFDFIGMGIDLVTTIHTLGMMDVDEDDDDYDDEEFEDRKKSEESEDSDEDEPGADTSQKLWFYGGGGGGGGAGGSAAPYGIGSGGSGGGGGGSGGSGAFIVGPKIGEDDDDALYINGRGGAGGLSYTGEAGTCGVDASEDVHGESEHVAYSNEVTHAVADLYNWRNGRLGTWSRQRDGDNWVFAGDGGAGGAAGGISSNYTLLVSSGARIMGADAAAVSNYNGQVVCNVTFKYHNGEDDFTDIFYCGTQFSSTVVPVAEGKFFDGYYTEEGGRGLQYFDKFGNSVGWRFLTGDLTLHACWRDTADDRGIRNIVHAPGCFYGEKWEGSTKKLGIVVERLRLSSETVYCFDEDFEYEAEQGNPALSLSQGTTVLYIPEGVTVTLKGGDGYAWKDYKENVYSEPGQPAILVPTNATLIVTGGGILETTGGQGSVGLAGSTGGGGRIAYYADFADREGMTVLWGGTGGNGGSGGGGGAPGIGGSGGKGGVNGSGAGGGSDGQWAFPTACSGKDGCGLDDCNRDFGQNGNAGSSGATGGAGEGCGNVYVLGGATVVATRGEALDPLLVEPAKSGSYSYDAIGRTIFVKFVSGVGHVDKWSYNSGPGGVGGGGGSGCAAAYGIGGGGGGGGAGGNGGGGSLIYWDNVDTESNYYVAGRYGQGGSGDVGGATFDEYDPAHTMRSFCVFEREGDDDKLVSGGAGGAGGAKGTGGDNGYLAVGPNAQVNYGVDGRRDPDDLVFGHPALERLITLTYQGRKIGQISAMFGEQLPTLVSSRLANIPGYCFAGAYLAGTEDDLFGPDYWYDEWGFGERIYDMAGDVTLEVEVEPKWDAMAEMPVSQNFEYDGTAKVGVPKSETYEIVDGTAAATNSGVYMVTVRLADGYEIWDDFLLYPEADTNRERKVVWSISKSDVDVGFSNQTYDWGSDDNKIVLDGPLPPGVTCEYSISRILSPGVYEIEAMINGGDNYRSKVLTAVYVAPTVLEIENVVPYYPWSTSVDIDFTLVSEYADDVLAKHERIEPYAMTNAVSKLRLNESNMCAFASVELSEAALGYGTITLDMKKAMPSGRGSVYVWLDIDGVPASRLIEIPVDTTAVPDSAGMPTYDVPEATDVLPLNYSWRFADGGWDYDAPVRLSIDGAAFEPIDSLGFVNNEGSVAWIPSASGYHILSVEIGEEGAEDLTRHFAAINVGHVDESTRPVVAVVNPGEWNERQCRSLASATEGLKFGDVVMIVGDVQIDAGKFPSGVEVVLGPEAKFRIPREGDLLRDHHDVVPTFSEDGQTLSGYRYTIDEEGSRPVFGGTGFAFEYDESGNLVRIRLPFANLKSDLYYSIYGKQNLSNEWERLCERVAAPGDGVQTMAVAACGNSGFYTAAATDDPRTWAECVCSTNGDGSLTLTRVSIPSGSSLPDGILRIPAEIDGHTLTAIDPNAFMNSSAAISGHGVEIPGSVKEIPKSLFQNTSVSSVILRYGVEKIGANAFSYSALRMIGIPSSVTSIGEKAFQYCNQLESVSIPSNVTEMGSYLFQYCESLKSVRFADGCTVVPAYAFYHCPAIESVELSDTITNICACAFLGGSSLRDVKLPAELRAIERYAFSSCDLGEVVFPDKLEQVGEYAFYQNTPLSNAVISASVKTMGDCCFQTCGIDDNRLSLRFLGDSPAGFSYSLFSRYNNEPPGMSIVSYVQAEASNWGYVSNLKRRYQNFSDWPVKRDPTGRTPTYLTATNDDGTVTFLGLGGDGYYYWTDFVVPEEIDGRRVTAIGDGAFENAEELDSVTIPAGVTAIGSRAFVNCGYKRYDRRLGDYRKSVIKFLGDAPMTVAEDAFSGTGNSCEILILPESEGWGAEIRSDRSARWQGVTLMYDLDGWEYTYHTEENPDGSLTLVGTGFIPYGELEVPGTIDGKTVTAIGARCFAGRDYLFKVTLPNSVKDIGDEAFSDCTRLSDLEVGTRDTPGTVAVGRSAFEGCKAFSNIVVKLASVGDRAFLGCESLTLRNYYLSPLEASDSLVSLGERAFEGCRSLGNVAISDSVTSIGAWCFKDCTGLTSARMPSGVDELPYGVFAGCTALVRYDIQTNVASIADRAFEGCTALRTVTMANAVTAIGNGVFSNCTSLTMMALSSALDTVGSGVFEGCTNLHDIAFFGNMPTSCPNDFLRGIADGQCHVIVPSGRNWNVSELWQRQSVVEHGAMSVVQAGDGLRLVGCNTNAVNSFILPDYIGDQRVTEIAPGVFGGRTINALRLPQFLRRIGESIEHKWSDGAFGGAEFMCAVFLPDGLEFIGDNTFKEACIRQIVIPASVTNVTRGAFLDMTGTFTSTGYKNELYFLGANPVQEFYEDVGGNKEETTWRVVFNSNNYEGSLKIYFWSGASGFKLKSKDGKSYWYKALVYDGDHPGDATEMNSKADLLKKVAEIKD